MILLNDSLNITLVGDWNKYYIQPEWMANNVFKKDEIEIGVNGQGSDFSISYRSDNVIIHPTQSRIIFSISNTDNETLSNLCRCVNNFVQKSYTPQPPVYGFNVVFVEDDGSIFANVLDSMSDTDSLVNDNYEIISTSVNRVLKCSDRIICMDLSLENSNLMIHFNEQHESEENRPNFTVERINDFIKKCKEILCCLGYEIEGDE